MSELYKSLYGKISSDVSEKELVSKIVSGEVRVNADAEQGKAYSLQPQKRDLKPLIAGLSAVAVVALSVVGGIHIMGRKPPVSADSGGSTPDITISDSTTEDELITTDDELTATEEISLETAESSVQDETFDTQSIAAVITEQWLSDWEIINQTDMVLPKANIMALKQDSTKNMYAVVVYPAYKTNAMRIYKISGGEVSVLAERLECGSSLEIYTGNDNLILRTKYNISGSAVSGDNIVSDGEVSEIFYEINDSGVIVADKMVSSYFDSNVHTCTAEVLDGSEDGREITAEEYKRILAEIISSIEYNKSEAIDFDNEYISFLDNPDSFTELMEEKLRLAWSGEEKQEISINVDIMSDLGMTYAELCEKYGEPAGQHRNTCWFEGSIAALYAWKPGEGEQEAAPTDSGRCNMIDGIRTDELFSGLSYPLKLEQLELQTGLVSAGIGTEQGLDDLYWSYFTHPQYNDVTFPRDPRSGCLLSG